MNVDRQGLQSSTALNVPRISNYAGTDHHD
jgi:hypothetical protein